MVDTPSRSLAESDDQRLDLIVSNQRAYFRSGATRSVEFRVAGLKRLRQVIKEYEGALLQALAADMGKPNMESYLSEVAFLYEEIDYTIKRLKGWMAPEKVSTPIILQPARSYVISEPLGIVLVIAPWNYPLQLTLAPLLGAMAAGNCAVVKTSELAPHTADVIAHLIAKAFAPEYVAVVEGGPEASTALLQLKFDYIFFTGGTGIGRIVARAAAEQLTPVTLELGGKSPCIVEADADLDVAAKRIAWGKWFNAGQTCVAPDYLLLHRSIKTAFLAKLRAYITLFFGADPAESPDFARIVNDKHFDRVATLIGGDVIIGGQTHRSTRYIAPTVIDSVTLTDPIMQGEIFGPLLPIITYDHLEEAFDVVRQMPNPLALYLFAQNKHVQERVLTELSFGGGCINNTLAHLANPSLPFGGVGASGMGRYHGRYSFDTFSHKKAVLHSGTVLEPNLKYQPYREKLKLIRRLIK